MMSPDLPPWLKRTIGLGMKLWRDALRTNLLQHAGGMAYTTLFSIIPFLAVTFAIISAFLPLANPNAAWFDTFRDFVLANLTPETGKQVVNYIETFLANLNVTKIGITGMISLFVTVILLLRNIELALNEIWMVKNPRSLIRRFILFWTFLSLGAVVLTLSLGLMSSFNITHLIRHGRSEGDAPATLVSVLGTFIFFAFLYKVGPNVRVTMKAACTGGAVATVLLRIASSSFTIYTIKSEFYESVYGALAALPFFLLWLYICWVITLFGALISWRTQQGFEVSTELDEVHKPRVRAPQDLERNAQVRAFMPFACVLAVNRAFVSCGRRGLTGNEIAKELDLPFNWVVEGLRVAAAMGYVVMASRSENDVDEAPVIGDSEHYPTLPPSEIGLRQLLLELTAPTLAWMETRDPSRPLGMARIAEEIRHVIVDPDYDLTLAELLRESERVATAPPPEIHH